MRSNAGARRDRRVSHHIIEWRLASFPTTQRVDAKIAASARKRSAAMRPVRADRERNTRTGAASIDAATVIHSGAVKSRAAWSSS